MKLQSLINRCTAALQEEAAADTAYIQGHPIPAKVTTPAATIDLYYYRQKDHYLCEATVTHHAGGPDRETTNLERHLAAALTDCVDWSAVEDLWRDREADLDEWQAHGFSSAADYWHYKGF